MNKQIQIPNDYGMIHIYSHDYDSKGNLKWRVKDGTAYEVFQKWMVQEKKNRSLSPL